MHMLVEYLKHSSWHMHALFLFNLIWPSQIQMGHLHSSTMMHTKCILKRYTVCTMASAQAWDFDQTSQQDVEVVNQKGRQHISMILLHWYHYCCLTKLCLGALMPLLLLLQHLSVKQVKKNLKNKFKILCTNNFKFNFRYINQISGATLRTH